MISKTVQWLGFLGSLALIAVAYWAANLLKNSGVVDGSKLLVFAVDLLPLLPVPLAAGTFPIHRRERIPMKRWFVFVGLIFLAQLAMEYQSVIFPTGDPALDGMFFIFLIGAVAMGAAYVFLVPRSRRSTSLH